MNPSALLALIADLYATNLALREQVTALEAQLAERPPAPPTD